MNTVKARNRILSLALAICLLLGMTLRLPGPVAARAEVAVGKGGGNAFRNPSDNGGTTSYQTVYYGGRDWRVLEVDMGNNELLLLSEGVVATRKFGHDWAYGGVDVRYWLNSMNTNLGNGTLVDYSSDGFTVQFSTGELTAISRQTVIRDGNMASQGTQADATGDYFYLLSSTEAGESAYFPNGNTDRKTDSRWWLRSPGDSSKHTALVEDNGFVYAHGGPAGDVSSSYGIRPAFRLDLSSVLFTSDASGASAKSTVGVANTLSSAASPQSGAVKLTVLDGGLTLAGVAPQDVNSRTVAFDYIGATAGKTLSAIVTAGDDTVKYYGQLEAGTSTSGSGIEVTVPADFATGDTLQIFVEELRNDYETDYAGAPVALMVVEQAVPTTPQGVGVTVAGNDGKITGVNDTMEYRKAGDAAWTRVPTNDTEITGLAPDDYEVRVAGKVEGGAAHLASSAKMVTVDRYLAPSLTMLPNIVTVDMDTAQNGDTVATADTQNFSGSPVTFIIDGTPLPAGLEIDSSDGWIFVDDASLLVAAPATAVTVKAVYNAESATDTVTITINAAGTSPPTGTAPTITTTALPNGEVGKPYSEALAADGDTPITWTVSGSLPLGLSLSSGGVISGTPEREETADFTVKAENAGGEDTKTLRIAIQADDSGNGGGDNCNNGGNTGGSSGSRSSSCSSGGSSTPDRQVPKTQLPTSAFSWDGDRTLTIDYERITPLGLLRVNWDSDTLAWGTDYSVYQGSVILRFGEDFMAAQSPGDHTVRVEFLNHTGEATVTVGETGAISEAGDNETYNPNTGGDPDGSYPRATDNPNTGDGRGIWFALLLGSLGGIVLVVHRLKPVA